MATSYCIDIIKCKVALEKELHQLVRGARKGNQRNMGRNPKEHMIIKYQVMVVGWKSVVRPLAAIFRTKNGVQVQISS